MALSEDGLAVAKGPHWGMPAGLPVTKGLACMMGGLPSCGSRILLITWCCEESDEICPVRGCGQSDENLPDGRELSDGLSGREPSEVSDCRAILCACVAIWVMTVLLSSDTVLPTSKTFAFHSRKRRL